MSSKLSKKKQTTSASLKKSDMDFYKMSALFFLLCCALLLILKVSTTLTMRQASGENMAYELYKLFRHPAYIAAVGVLFVGSVVWTIVVRVKKINESFRVFSSLNALALMLYVAGFSVYFGVHIVNNPADCMFALAVTIALALLYYVSKFFHRDFLMFSVENALLALLLYRYWHVYTVRGIVGKVLLVIAFAAAGAALGNYLKKQLSRPHTGKGKDKNSTALVFPYFVSLAIWTVCMFIKLPDIKGAPLIPSGVMLTILLIQYLVFAIIYTIKLIRE